MPTLSADEFAAKYGQQPASQTTLSADEFGKRYGSVADNAKASLANRGLTPEMVKAGQGVTQPEDIKFADAKTVNGGFLGGAASALNPLSALDSMLGAAQKMTVMGGAPPNAAEAARAVGGAVGVPDLAGIAQESYRRGGANESRSDMYGGAAAAAAMAAAGRAFPSVADQAGKYAAVVDPSGTHPLAPTIAQEMFDQNIIMRNPKLDIAKYAESRATAGDAKLTSAVANMPRPVDASEVSATMQRVKASLYNNDTGAPLRPDSDQIAAKIDAYEMNHIMGNAKAFRDPSGNIAYQMDPKVALELKRNFDAAPYGKGSETGVAEAQKAVGDSLRGQLNTDPGVAAANAEINKYLTAKNEIAPRAARDTLPTAKRVGGAVLRTAVAEGVGAAFPPARTAAHVLAGGLGLASMPSIVIDAVRSPLWKTTSAVMKARFARAVASNNLDVAANISRAIVAGNAVDGNP